MNLGEICASLEIFTVALSSTSRIARLFWTRYIVRGEKRRLKSALDQLRKMDHNAVDAKLKTQNRMHYYVDLAANHAYKISNTYLIQ